MLHGAPDAECFDKEQWKRDELREAYCDDALWGYMVRISKQLPLRVPGEYEVDVLFKLICMGVFNWDGDGHKTNALTQAMRHSTVMVHWVLERVRRVEMMVSRLPILAC